MRTVILGGGLGGLSAAFYMLKKFTKETVTVIESSSRLGGWIRSFQQHNGVVFEQGPRTIRTAGAVGANTLEMLEEIGLQDQIVPITQFHPAATNRLIYANGSLNRLPSSFMDIFTKQPPFSKPLIFQLLKDVMTPGKKVPEMDEPLYDFVHRRFGSEIADYVISPMVCGICAGDAKEISVNFLMKSLFEMEQHHGSVTRGLIERFFQKKEPEQETSGLVQLAREEKWSVFSFLTGMEMFPKTLGQYISKKGGDIRLNSSCTEIETFDDKVVLKFNNGEELEANDLISSVPAETLAGLLKHQHPQLSELLRYVQYSTVAVVNLCFDNQVLKNEAFGFLVAPKENLPVLGVIYDSCCFPAEDKTILTVMMGGFRFNQYFGDNPNDQFLYDTAVNHTKNILKISENPTNSRVQVLKNCIPQYTVGHNKRLTAIEDYIKANHLPIYLCGASYYGVGINDVIFSAKNVVESI